MPNSPNWLRPASLILSTFVVLAALYPVFAQAARIFV
jgi:hypothetical protein